MLSCGVTAAPAHTELFIWSDVASQSSWDAGGTWAGSAFLKPTRLMICYRTRECCWLRAGAFEEDLPWLCVPLAALAHRVCCAFTFHGPPQLMFPLSSVGTGMVHVLGLFSLPCFRRSLEGLVVILWWVISPVINETF